MGKRLCVAGFLIAVLGASIPSVHGETLASHSRTSEPQDPQRSALLVVPRLSGPITLDGSSDEPAWSSVTPFVLVQHSPNFGSPPTEKTEVLVGFDDEHLYVAGRLYDREPGKIQSYTKKRDSMSPSSDWFGVLFDTFNVK